MSETLRVEVPGHWTHARAAVELAGLAKALKDPTVPIDRASARQRFLRQQGRFRTRVHDIFEQALDDKFLPGAAESRAFNRRKEDLKQTLTVAYEDAFQWGLIAGGASRGLSPEEQGRGFKRNERAIVAKQAANEAAFGANFLTDVLNGEGKMPYQKRADMYANALEELYWQGYIYADLSSDRYIRWHLQHGVGFSEPESCEDCSILSGDLRNLSDSERQIVAGSGRVVGGRWGNGVYSVQDLAKLGVTPQSGKLACTTRCHCELVPAKRPDRVTVNPAPGEFRSVRPKEFTGTLRRLSGVVDVLREHREERRRRLAHEAERTEHEHIRRGK